MVVEGKYILKREMVGPAVIHRNTVSGYIGIAGVVAGVTVILHMALPTDKPSIVFIEEGNFTGEAAQTHVNHFKISALFVFVPKSVGLRSGKGLD